MKKRVAGGKGKQRKKGSSPITGNGGREYYAKRKKGKGKRRTA